MRILTFDYCLIHLNLDVTTLSKIETKFYLSDKKQLVIQELL